MAEAMTEVDTFGEAIVTFQGEYRFLSNFYPARVSLGFTEYPTVEHAFQAAKTTEQEERDAILRAKKPGEAKRLGRRVALRPHWEEIKETVMLGLLWQKFEYGDNRIRLLETSDAELIEGNYWHDQYWGSCYCPQHEGEPGRNRLGELLMQIRAKLARQEAQ